MVYLAVQLHSKIFMPLVNGGNAGMRIISDMAAFITKNGWTGMTKNALLSQLVNFGSDADLAKKQIKQEIGSISMIKHGFCLSAQTTATGLETRKKKILFLLLSF